MPSGVEALDKQDDYDQEQKMNTATFKMRFKERANQVRVTTPTQEVTLEDVLIDLTGEMDLDTAKEVHSMTTDAGCPEKRSNMVYPIGDPHLQDYRTFATHSDLLAALEATQCELEQELRPTTSLSDDEYIHLMEWVTQNMGLCECCIPPEAKFRPPWEQEDARLQETVKSVARSLALI